MTPASGAPAAAMPQQDAPKITPTITPVDWLRDYWMQPWRHADALGRASLGWIALCHELPRSTRDRWLAGLGQTIDRYLRSPAFLELMRHNLEAVTRATQLALHGRPR